MVKKEVIKYKCLSKKAKQLDEDFYKRNLI